MTVWKEYEIRMPDGTKESLTAKEIAERSGLPVQLIQKRLGRWRFSWDALTEPVAQSKRNGRKAFLRGIEATFAEAQQKRADNAAHEEKVRKGNADLR